jgi:hypothetical protein
MPEEEKPRKLWGNYFHFEAAPPACDFAPSAQWLLPRQLWLSDLQVDLISNLRLGSDRHAKTHRWVITLLS